MLGIVLVVYKSFQETIDYVSNEISKITIPYKLVIVDNSSTIQKSEKLANACGAVLVEENKTIASSNIFLISTEYNLGYAKGNNIGAEFLKKEFKVKYILFSNNDLQLLDCNICQTLISKLENNDDIGIIGPRVLGLKGEDQSPRGYISFNRYFAWNLFPFLKGKVTFLKKNADSIPVSCEGTYCYWVSGCFFMVRAADFFKAGMFDSNTFLYGEEKMLSERLLKIDKKCYYEPSVKVLHVHGGTTSNFLQKKRIEKMVFDNECYYYRNYLGINPLLIQLLKLTRKFKSKWF